MNYWRAVPVLALIAALAFLSILTGCTYGAPQVSTQVVDVPVEVSCVHKDIPEPAWNVPGLEEDADYAEKLRAVLGDLDLARGYIVEMQAQLKACR